MSEKIKYLACAVLFLTLLIPGYVRAQEQAVDQTTNKESLLLERMHKISSHDIFARVKTLCSEEFGGRLTGTEGYNRAAHWAADLFRRWGIEPAGDNGGFLQEFPSPYTLVLESGELILHIPYRKNSKILKHYQYEKDFCPGSTSDSGELTSEVIYVGFGITAPELNYDDYKGLDVRGKIVMMEPEVPGSPSKTPDLFKKWRPYSFHQYKVKNALKHGAAGMMYNYHITNPNCLFIKNFLISYVGTPVVDDIFTGTGKSHKDLVDRIKKSLKPQSFNTRKLVTITAVTQHHPEGVGCNVIGKIEGSDPVLKEEVIVLGAHLDHVGRNHLLMPGANDNASGTAVILTLAEAMAKFSNKPKRTIMFILFGAEEKGVMGSEYYVNHPAVPNERIKVFINVDGVGRGEKIGCLGAKNYPRTWGYFDKANRSYIHRNLRTLYFHNLARPRLDAARFMTAGVPSLTFGTFGGTPLPYPIYHKTTDSPDIINPEIMEDMARLLFMTLADLTEAQF